MSSVWAEVDAYFGQRLLERDEVLEGVTRRSREAGLPAIAVPPLQGKLLHLLVKMTGARRVLEIGTLAGYSAIWMGRALPVGGRLITLEMDPKHAAMARENVDLAGLSDVVEVRDGLASESLARITAAGEGPFDFVFVDADKPNNPVYFEWALKLTKSGSVIVVDNVVRNGAVVESDSSDANVQGVQRLAEMLAKEKRVTATAIQTVSGKAYDGFVIMIVNG